METTPTALAPPLDAALYSALHFASRARQLPPFAPRAWRYLRNKLVNTVVAALERLASSETTDVRGGRHDVDPAAVETRHTPKSPMWTVTPTLPGQKGGVTCFTSHTFYTSQRLYNNSDNILYQSGLVRTMTNAAIAAQRSLPRSAIVGRLTPPRPRAPTRRTRRGQQSRGVFGPCRWTKYRPAVPRGQQRETGAGWPSRLGGR